LSPMWIAKNNRELRETLTPANRPVILVPTMGALHPGHASLISLAREKAGKNGTVIVSIFVNPIQFDRSSDLENYPPPLDADLALCASHGADGVCLPSAESMYHPDRSTAVLENQLSQHLCG